MSTTESPCDDGTGGRQRGLHPHVTVFIQSYNYEEYVSEAIESVLAQTYTDFELLIIDDGSTDRSPEIIAEYGRRHPHKIRYVNRPDNRGLVATYNEAIPLVRGRLFVALSSDDRLPPDALEHRVRYFEEHPEVDLLATDFDLLDRHGNKHSGRDKLTLVPQFARLYEVDFRDLYTPLLDGNFMPDCTVTMSFARIDPSEIRYDPNCPNVSDYELWLRLAKTYRWGFLPQSTCVYRWHGRNLSDARRSRPAVIRHLTQMTYVLSNQLMTELTPHRARAARNSLACNAVLLNALQRSSWSRLVSALFVLTHWFPIVRARFVHKFRRAASSRRSDPPSIETTPAELPKATDTSPTATTP